MFSSQLWSISLVSNHRCCPPFFFYMWNDHPINGQAIVENFIWLQSSALAFLVPQSKLLHCLSTKTNSNEMWEHNSLYYYSICILSLTSAFCPIRDFSVDHRVEKFCDSADAQTKLAAFNSYFTIWYISLIIATASALLLLFSAIACVLSNPLTYIGYFAANYDKMKTRRKNICASQTKIYFTNPIQLLWHFYMRRKILHGSKV